MAELNVTTTIPTQTVTYSFQIEYLLLLPNGVTWAFEDLRPGMERRFPSGTYYTNSGKLTIPIDVITAARLGLVKRGDDSGLGEEQWAWMNLIGLTGEK